MPVKSLCNNKCYTNTRMGGGKVICFNVVTLSLSRTDIVRGGGGGGGGGGMLLALK